MKIKNQFRILIIGIVTVPLLLMISVPIYQYQTSPERLLMRTFKNVESKAPYPLSSKNWEALQEEISRLPPSMEVAVILNKEKILFSTIPDVCQGDSCSEGEFLSIIADTSNKYFYQIVSFPGADTGSELIAVSRAPKNNTHRQRPPFKFILPGLYLLVAFELLCIFAIVLISNTVSRSIMILEERTQRIAGGDLDTQLKFPVRRRDSNEITSLTENLEKMRQALKEDRERRSRFIMGISHDLRTPVAVIKGYTEAISDGIASDPNAIIDAVNIISNKTNQLEGMIDTLINFEKLSSNEWRNKLVSQPLRTMLVDFAKSFEMTATVFKRNIITDISISDDICVPFDKQLLQRALENLTSNAIRYSNDNDNIFITAKEHNGTVSVSIRDTGQGIAPEDVDHIFDMFYRGTNSRREQGMGIGLAVVKNIIDTHGWNIAVESEKGYGTNFIITIPVPQSEPQETDSTAEDLLL